MQTNESGEDDLTNRLAALVKKMKENEQLRQEYMAMNLHDYDMIRKGAQEKALETAQKLLADGKYTAEEISALLGIPVESFAEAQPAPAN